MKQKADRASILVNGEMVATFKDVEYSVDEDTKEAVVEFDSRSDKELQELEDALQKNLDNFGSHEESKKEEETISMESGSKRVSIPRLADAEVVYQHAIEQGCGEEFARLVADVANMVRTAIEAMVLEKREFTEEEVDARLQETFKAMGAEKKIDLHPEVLKDFTNAVNEGGKQLDVEEYIDRFSE